MHASSASAPRIFIIQNPPAFLLRCLAACLANISKQFERYSRFWKLLRDIGIWQHLCHLQNKTKFTTKDDPKKIFPPHLIPSSNGYLEIHDGTFPLIGASQKILPKSKGDLVHGLTYKHSFDYIISHHVDILHKSYFSYMLQWHFILHVVISLIFIIIIQTVYTFFILYSGLFLRVDNFRERLERPSKIFFVL